MPTVEGVTLVRLISLPAHGAIELALGAALMVAPFALALGPAAIVAAVATGAVLIGLGLATTATSDDARGSIPVSAHASCDFGMALGMLAAALILGVAGDGAAAVVFLTAALLQLMLAGTTRYSPVRV